MVLEATPHASSLAFGDESFRERTDGTGYYVLAAAVIEARSCDEVRDRMRGLLTRSPKAKLHWKDLEDPQRLRVIEAVAGLPTTHLVTVGTPLAPRRQERARRCCLEELVVALEARGVETLYLENRPRQLNRKDIDTLDACRAKKQASRLRVRHALPSEEPALWVADVVAGAYGSTRGGMDPYWAPLAELVTEIEVRIR